MTSYDLGDGIPLEHYVYDRDGQLVAATVSLTVTKPSGATVVPTVTSPSTGLYRAAIVSADLVGNWSGVWTVSGNVVDSAPVTFQVRDPGPQAYIDLVTVKNSLGKLTVDDRDDLIQQAISAASRLIDQMCGRRFWSDRIVSARTVPISGKSWCEDGYQTLIVPDIADSTGLIIETGSPAAGWTAVTGLETDVTGPADFAGPITRIRGAAGWLPSSGRARVTARWGCPAVPDEIGQAALLLATRLYRRKDSPQGVIGSAEWGSIRVSRTDPDVQALIAPYVIPAVA